MAASPTAARFSKRTDSKKRKAPVDEIQEESTSAAPTTKKSRSKKVKVPAMDVDVSDIDASASPPAAPATKAQKSKPQTNDASEDEASASPPPLAAQKKQKPKQKKNPKSSDDQDALLDLDLGVNTIFSRMDPDLLADYVAASTKRFGSDLSSVELSDLYVPAGAIRDTTSFAETRVKEKLPDFLESCVAGESEIEQKRLGSAPKEKGAPHTIVVAGAGLRAADLVRAARKFQKKDNVVAKLFAKHFKVSEQVEFLKKNRTGIAIGTPARLINLLDCGALSVQHLKRIVIDASHIDQKKRGIMDMKDTMMPLAKWLSRKEFKDKYAAETNPVELLFF
ncbi:Protein cms1 [Gnomoniopsis smithogilvyi]|uniref:Protein cms1 n=1 Tax=Gnomoniopsis smithogilvyi TaxID=1191159 RepID=A0A9W8YL77_9PEZI|nr:Protein cms1 [Gnomoniopsis smithogilvyi]